MTHQRSLLLAVAAPLLALAVAAPDAPYNGSFASGVQRYDFMTTYLSGSAFQASSTTDELIKFTEDVVSYDPNDATKKGPLGKCYARRVRVLRPR